MSVCFIQYKGISQIESYGCGNPRLSDTSFEVQYRKRIVPCIPVNGGELQIPNDDDGHAVTGKSLVASYLIANYLVV
jgi:hypothetical protein